MKYKKSRLLLVSMRPWPVIDPLVRAFDAAGFAVALAHGQAGGPPVPSVVARLYPARPPQFRPTIEFALRDLAPDLVVPTDQASFHHLAALEGGQDDAVVRPILRSLGNPDGLLRLASAGALQHFARDHGLPVPNSVKVSDETGLRALLASVPLPVMLKRAGDTAGPGAEAVRSLEAGIAAYHRLAGAGGHVRRWLARNLPLNLSPPAAGAIAIQQYVDGIGAKRLVAARDGEVLAGISIEPLDGSGPALVAKFIRHPAMAEIAASVVRGLNLSGLLGFDFVLEHGSRQVWLVAVKPYASPIAHLAAAGEPSLPAALHDAFAGHARRLPHPANDVRLIGAAIAGGRG